MRSPTRVNSPGAIIWPWVVISISAERSSRRARFSTSSSSQAVAAEIATASPRIGSRISRNPNPQLRSARISPSAAIRPTVTSTPNRKAIGTVWASMVTAMHFTIVATPAAWTPNSSSLSSIRTRFWLRNRIVIAARPIAPHPST